MFSIELPPAPVAAEVRPAVIGDERTLSWDATSLLRGGRRWMPVMGEMHYARVPADTWEAELRKLKAGGLDVVATYVFWIHHEEVEGEANWIGERELGRFVRTAQACGLEVVVRIGPWCHGEVRNGGLPDWVVERFGDRARTDDPGYLDAVRRHFLRIAQQLRGLLWADGGPVAAFQIENEYGGPAEHLLTLKRLARECGLEAPLYTRTGWPDLATPMPFGELLPLYGAYAEGFWDRALTSMPGFYPAGFRFSSLRTDAAIATDLLGERAARDPEGTERYPFLTCEIGGGMMSSYHRRIRIDPRDIESVVVTKLGSGGNLPGYYMYRGGVNPEGRTTLNETQASRYWNDLPVKNYDFQAPLGAAGQVRPHYHLLRRLHLFVGDFGALLAGMPAVFPEKRPVHRDDTHTLRWAVRGAGGTGFVFINNYERLRPLPAKGGVRFSLSAADGSTISFPSQAVVFPADTTAIWPFGIDVAPGVRLDHATARLLCKVDDGSNSVVFLAETPGVRAELAVNGRSAVFVAPGRGVALSVDRPGGGAVRFVVLSHADSLQLWKLDWRGRERAVLSRAAVSSGPAGLRVEAENPADLVVGVFPSVDEARRTDGVFSIVQEAGRLDGRSETVRVYPVSGYGAARQIELGWTTPPVAVAPNDRDFEAAATWRIELPKRWDSERFPLLRLRYAGDVVRIRVGGRLVLDDFYNGDVLEMDLARFADGLAAGEELVVEILPLTPDAPILLPLGTRPAELAARIEAVELVARHRVVLP